MGPDFPVKQALQNDPFQQTMSVKALTLHPGSYVHVWGGVGKTYTVVAACIFAKDW